MKQEPGRRRIVWIKTCPLVPLATKLTPLKTVCVDPLKVEMILKKKEIFELASKKTKNWKLSKPHGVLNVSRLLIDLSIVSDNRVRACDLEVHFGWLCLPRNTSNKHFLFSVHKWNGQQDKCLPQNTNHNQGLFQAFTLQRIEDMVDFQSCCVYCVILEEERRKKSIATFQFKTVGYTILNLHKNKTWSLPS